MLEIPASFFSTSISASSRPWNDSQFLYFELPAAPGFAFAVPVILCRFCFLINA